MADQPTKKSPIVHAWQVSESRPFQVDLRGVVDLLSRHIYSSPQVYLRELLQNGRDAIRARRLVDPSAPQGLIQVEVEGQTVIVTDNGIGLTSEEATELLATVGRSSKRDEVLGLRRSDFLGQFGIGLLSCFLVADEIIVRSRSAVGGQAIEWIGSAEGTFRISCLEQDLPIGTQIRLHARADEAGLCAPEQVRELLKKFGEFLPDVIRFADERINRPAPFLPEDQVDPDDMLWFGQQLTGTMPLDMIQLSVPGSATSGVAYVLPFSPPPGAKQVNRVYLGRMLLGERVADLLPEWAFFVRCVLNTEDLSPTASRESLVENEALNYTREELGRQIREWIINLANNSPLDFQAFVAAHQLALKSMALHDDRLAAALLPHIVVETSSGSWTIGELIASDLVIRYTSTVDEFRQIAAVIADEAPVVNAGYTLDVELLRRLPQIFPTVNVRQIGVPDVLAQLDQVPADDVTLAEDLAARAQQDLAQIGCQVVVRCFQPDDLDTLYLSSPAALRKLDRDSTIEKASPMWATVLGQVDEIVSREQLIKPQLCLNWSSMLVRELAGVEDELVFARTVRMLYVQALLAGHHPLRAMDRALLSGAMRDLVHLSVFRTG